MEKRAMEKDKSLQMQRVLGVPQRPRLTPHFVDGASSIWDQKVVRPSHCALLVTEGYSFHKGMYELRVSKA